MKSTMYSIQRLAALSLRTRPISVIPTTSFLSNAIKPTYPGLKVLRCFSTGEIIEVKLPVLADSIDSGTLATWEKKVGDFCNIDDTIATVDTDKVTVDVKTPASGELVEALVQVGDELKVGDLICKIMPKAAPAQAAKSDAPKAAESAKKEVKQESKAAPAAVAKPETPKKADAPKPATSKEPEAKGPQVDAPAKQVGGRGTTAVKMTPMRKKTAERLKESQNTAATLTTFNEIDMSNLFAMRNKYKDMFLEKHGVKLGFMSAFVAASVKALQELPVVNAKIENDHIIYHDFIDISIAVSSPRGLVVPVLRNCETMSFLDVEREIVNLGKKAKENKLTLEEMQGGTFTVTNGGVFGSMMSTPMINMPQSAILGMHAVKERAVVVDGEIKIRPMMYVAMTYDHRIIDGRESVTFLKSIKEKVEDPQRLLLGL